VQDVHHDICESLRQADCQWLFNTLGHLSNRYIVTCMYNPYISTNHEFQLFKHDRDYFLYRSNVICAAVQCGIVNEAVRIVIHIHTCVSAGRESTSLLPG
jgi:hypothetical protein